MRSIGDLSLPVFFRSLHISGLHHVPPTNTPLIVCSNHPNTILDVAMLASHMRERRPLHFWAKSDFFHNRLLGFILTSSGNISVDRKNKSNQSLFHATFQAMKAGGAIALFPEGGSYTIPKLASLKMGAAWAALEYSRYLQLAQQGERVQTGVSILPTAVVYDDKSVFRSRAMLKFGKPLSLDGYIDEFLSLPSTVEAEVQGCNSATSKVRTQAGQEPSALDTAENAVRSSKTQPCSCDGYASRADRAVARLTADLQTAMEELTFNAPDWETFQAVRVARELIFELHDAQAVSERMHQYVELSRALMTLLTLERSSRPYNVKRQSTQTRRALFTYSSILHLAHVDNLTLARTVTEPRRLSAPLTRFLLRLPVYIPIFALTLIPTYVLPGRVAHYFAAREQESLSSVKTLVGFLFTSLLYSTLALKTLSWIRWSPPALLVAVAGVWWLHDLNRTFVDEAYALVKQLSLAWRMYAANVPASPATLIADAHVGKQKHNVEPQAEALFFYGTLVHPNILARVIGNDGAHLTVQNAVLDGAKLFHVKGADYPGLLHVASSPASINAVKGTLVTGLTRADLRCLDAFEGDEYVRTRVDVIPDPAARAESNAERIANAASAPLDAILCGLDNARIGSLCVSTHKRVQAQVYTWIAGRDKLHDHVWQFDVFAQIHAANWLGQADVKQQDEYDMVDRVRFGSDDSSTCTAAVNSDADPRFEQDVHAWIARHASTLVEDGRIQSAVVEVCKMLADQPSIQFFVDLAFTKQTAVSRPKLADRGLLNALCRARIAARSELQELIAAVAGVEDQELKQAVETLMDAKLEALGRIGATTTPEAAWPFESLLRQRENYVECRKTL